jgi:hypothetical protein
VAANKAAFLWGRLAAHDPTAVDKLLTPAQVVQFQPRETLDSLLAHRATHLSAYQNDAYARLYRDFVERVRSAEAPLGKTQLTEAVARGLFKLMAYKDEYEVARLHTDRAFLGRIAGQFEGDFKLHYHLAPPLLAKTNDKGELIKRPFGPWMGVAFQVLARLKFLRGTDFDPFGRSAERRRLDSRLEARGRRRLRLAVRGSARESSQGLRESQGDAETCTTRAASPPPPPMQSFNGAGLLRPQREAAAAACARHSSRSAAAPTKSCAAALAYHAAAILKSCETPVPFS